MTEMSLSLDPAITAWLRRLDELASGTSSATSERSRSREVSDLLFTEFGIMDAARARRTTHIVPTAEGDMRVDEYRPVNAAGPLPAYLLLHGGAFRLGELDEAVNVAFCSKRAADADYAVFSADYALAPERPHPAASHDAQAALLWLLANGSSLEIDLDRLVVGGVSAGGALSASLCAWARDKGYDIRGQLLEVPVVDLSDSAPWLPEFAVLNGLPSPREIRTGYVSDEEAALPEVSPLRGHLHGLPPTHLMTAEFDPLRAGGEELARRLREAGNRVTGTRHFGALHGTQSLLRDYRGARLWHAEVVSVLRDFAS